MVRRDTPSSCAAWSSETLRPMRGSKRPDDEDGEVTVMSMGQCSGRPTARVVPEAGADCEIRLTPSPVCSWTNINNIEVHGDPGQETGQTSFARLRTVGFACKPLG